MHVNELVAVAGQRFGDGRGVDLRQHAGAAQVALSLAREPHLQMACAGPPMLGLAGSTEAKPLLYALVGLLLGHR